jgi:hypothetical protein
VTPSSERRPAAAGYRIMLAMVAAMTAILALAVVALWRESRPYEDVTASIHAEPIPQATASYAYHLARLVKDRCGDVPAPQLEAAAAVEKQDDPELERRAAAEARARAATITTWQSCDYVISEIRASEQRAAASILRR